MATLQDVAAAAGVSKSTASRALSNPALVAPSTTKRVLAAAFELGFVPNRAARTLARGRSGIVALIVPTLRNAFFTPIISGVQERAIAEDLQLTVVVNTLDSPQEVERFQRLEREVDGVLIAAPKGNDEQVRSALSPKPVVLIDRELTGLDSVVADTAATFGQLVAALAREGHAHLLYLGGPEQSWQNAQREDKIRAVAQSWDIRVDVLGPFPPTFAAGDQLAETAATSEATAVVPYASDLGLGLLLGLHRRNVASWNLRPPTPGRLFVSGVPGAPMVAVNGEELGERAMSVLARRIAQPAEPPTTVRLQVPLEWP